MSKTRIVILHMKEIIYTAIFVGLGILLLVLLVIMFVPKDDDSQVSSDDVAKYKAGVYNSQIALNNAILNLEVVVDRDQIKSVRFVNLDDSVTTSYPLIEPAMNYIREQIENNVPIEDIVLKDDSKYTQTVILDKISETLEKADTAPTAATK